MAADLHAETSSKYVKKKQTTQKLVGEHLISSPDDTEPISIHVAATLPSGEYVFVDKANKNIKLVDQKFVVKDVLKLSTYPFDICASNKVKTEVYVTEPEIQTIHCIRVSKGSIKLMTSTKIWEDCRGITCWKAGVAVSVMREGFVGVLALLDYNCTLHKKVWESTLDTSVFKAPWYLGSIQNGNKVVVSDQGNHSIICINVRDFVVVFNFKSEHLIGPRSLTVDANDNIYVIGSSESCHNVVKISSEGKMIGIYLCRKDLLNYPSGISYNATEKTIILQRDREKSTICVYSI